jgi:phosphate transport system substrate-binding protein
VPLRRSDSSGDTFLFSSYLSAQDPAWSAAIGYGTTVAWPKLSGERAFKGNSAMVTGCQATPGCVAYVGITYLTSALAGGLGEAQLMNASGHFLLPAPAAIRAAVASFVAATPPNETISMIDGPAADGYPIVNYEYAIVSTHQPDARRAAEIRAFLQWVITVGDASAYLDPTRLQPLPAPVAALGARQIARITS